LTKGALHDVIALLLLLRLVLFFASDGDHVTVQPHIDVGRLDAGQFRADADFPFAFAHIQLGCDHQRALRFGPAADSGQEVIEKPIHLSMEFREGVSRPEIAGLRREGE